MLADTGWLAPLAAPASFAKFHTTNGGFMARSDRRRALSAVGAALVAGVVSLAPAQATEGDLEIKVGDLEEAIGAGQASGVHRTQPDSPAGMFSTLASPEECLTSGGDENLTVLRYAGPNRYETGVCVSYWTWPDYDDPQAPPEAKAEVVVLARGDNFPDALAGGPLAAYGQGPLLLTQPSTLHSAVENEIKRVLAPGGLVYLLGGTSSISGEIESGLDLAGYKTTRLAGSNRYETAIAVAEELPDTSNFFFATGQNFPDALGAGTAAGALSISARESGDPDFRPFALLLTADDQLPDSVFDFVDDRGLQFGVWTLVTSGGWATRAVENAFGAESIAASFAGANRYETATQIAESVFTFDTGELVGFGAGLATGLNFPDALAATASLAQFSEPLLLTSPTQLSGATADFLGAHAGEGPFLDVFGGTSTVSQAVADAAEQAFRQ